MFGSIGKKRGERHARRPLAMLLALVMCLAAIPLLPAGAQGLETPSLDGATVYIVNAETGRYLDGDRDGAVRQSLVPNEDDQWIVSAQGSGTYAFKNVQKGRYLDGDGAHRNYDVNLSHNLESDTQWELTQLPNGSFQIRNLEFGLWLDGDYASKQYNVDLTSQGNETDAHWYIAVANAPASSLAGATVLLSNGQTGRYLSADADGDVSQSIAPGATSTWYVDGDANGYTFTSIDGDRTLQVAGADVTTLGLGGAAAQWGMTQVADGTYEIQSNQAGLWLDADKARENYAVDLTDDPSERDGRWNVLVVAGTDCSASGFDSLRKALFCVDADDVFVHLQALQDIADANGGVRQSGTPGYDASADYVAGLLTAAGLTVERQVFSFSVYTENSVSLSIAGAAIDTQTTTYSESGTVNDGNVVAVDLDLGPDNASSSGCEAADFVGLDFSGTNDIALVQRGACAFSTKAINAQDAGAEAVIIFNQGNTEERKGIIGSTLGTGLVGILTIPVLDIGYDDGVTLSTAMASSMVSLSADTTIATSSTENIIADMPGLNPDNVVMAGAHLDSVPQGPGIQDNGTGSATILSVALALANNPGYTPQNSLRFAWWGAEEAGLIGSNEYIFNPDFGITDEEYAALAAYLNFDMVGSPNFVYGVYDADESTFDQPDGFIPDGSAALEDLFEAYYSVNDVPYDDSAFSGRSDYAAFISVGIPASGLFTGAEEIKTAEQAAIWGGTVGEQFDECYHLACDTIENVSHEAVEVNVDAIMYSIYNLAASTEAVNGVAGVDVNGPTPADVTLDGPQGTFIEGGGGLDHDHDHDGGEPS